VRWLGPRAESGDCSVPRGVVPAGFTAGHTGNMIKMVKMVMSMGVDMTILT
jgi:hypothetical protein